MIQRRKFTSGVGAVALVIAIGACSSSSKNATSATTTANTTTGNSTGNAASATTSSATTSGAPITVGLVCSCSGPFGPEFVDAVDVYKAWVNTINGSGGIEGHPVHLKVEDDASLPGTSSSDAQVLVSDHVDAIVDMTTFDTTWETAVKAAGIPVVGGNTSSTPFYTNSDFYPEGQTYDSTSYSNAYVAKESGATNYAGLYCAETPVCLEGINLVKDAAKTMGLSDILNASISGTAPNYTAQCIAAQQAHAQAIFLALGASTAVRVGADCDLQGYHPTYFGGGIGWSLIYVTSKGVNQNFWAEVTDLPFNENTPSTAAMNAAVDKYYPGIRNNAMSWSEQAALAWPSGLLLEDAVKAGGLGTNGTPSSAEIVQGLASLKGDTLQGWAPPLTFVPGKPHLVDCWFTAVVRNGALSMANGGKSTCENTTPST